MRILINTASTFKGGGVQVAKSFIEECRNFSSNQYFVVLSDALSKMIDINNFPGNFSFFNAPFRPATVVFKWRSHNYFFKDIEIKWKPDVVFTTSGPSYWRPQAPHLMGYNLPHYIYPESPYFGIIPLKRKLWWTGMKIFARYIFKRDADAFVVQTNDVNDRLKKFLNRREVHTAYNTINAYYLKYTKVPDKLPVKKPSEFRLLTLSAWYPHKNLIIIPKIAEALKHANLEIKFVVTLPKKDFKRLTGNYNSPNIINVGPVKVEEAPSLYKECDAMFLPTLLECFSASYVEAMKMEKPIITSDMGFAHTVCEDAALYINPMNAEDIATKIVALVNSTKLQNQLIENGLKRVNAFGTPEGRAKKYLDICQNLIEDKKHV